MTETPEERVARIAEWEREPSHEEIDQAIVDARRPALLLNKTKFPDDLGEPGCWLHGEPTLPTQIEWPHQEVGGVPWPMFFVGQINLARVPRSSEYPVVPKSGMLFFFYDPVLDTSEAKVIYFDGDVSKFPSRKMPTPEYRPVDEWSYDDAFEVIEENVLPKWNFDFLEICCFDEHTKNRSINHKIRQVGYDAYLAVEEQNKNRWSSSEPGSLKKMGFSFIFGCQPNATLPKGDPVLLLVLGGNRLQLLDFQRSTSCTRF